MLENSLIMYFVVRKSLNMSEGKIGAQCAHAMEYIYTKYLNNKFNDSNQERMKEYLSKPNKKIILLSEDKDWDKIKLNYEHAVVIDFGLNQVPEGSETVIALVPIYKEDRKNFLKRMRIA